MCLRDSRRRTKSGKMEGGWGGGESHAIVHSGKAYVSGCIVSQLL